MEMGYGIPGFSTSWSRALLPVDGLEGAVGLFPVLRVLIFGRLVEDLLDDTPRTIGIYIHGMNLVTRFGVLTFHHENLLAVEILHTCIRHLELIRPNRSLRGENVLKRFLF